MTDDTELLRRYAEEKSDEAFGELVQRHIDFVYAAALRQARGNSALAQDVTQVVFADLARKAATLARHEVIVGWLHTATRFAAIKAIRGESRREAREREAYAMNETLGESDAPVDWERLHPVLDEVLGELKERERAAILLRFFEKKPLAEVGAKLSLTESAARSCVDRALQKMHGLLAQRGVTSTAAALGVALAGQAAVAAPAGLAASVTTAALVGTAAVGGGAAIAVNFLNLMSTSKIVSGVAGIIAVLAVGTAIYQTKQAGEIATTVTSLSTERDDLRARLAALEKRAKQADENLAVSQKELGDLRVAAAKPAEPARSAPSQGAVVDYVMDHPETHAAYVEQQVLRSKVRFERFVKAAGLSAAQQEEFYRQIRERGAAELDFMVALRAQGYGVGNLPQDQAVRAAFQKMGTDMKEKFDGGMRAVLGDDGYKSYQQFGATLPERNVVDELGGQLYLSANPLTASQADQLTQLLQQSRYTGQPTATPTTTMNGTLLTRQAMLGAIGLATQQGGQTMLDWRAPITDAAIARAETVLTAPQLATLRQMQAQQLAQFQTVPPPPAGSPGAVKLGGAK